MYQRAHKTATLTTIQHTVSFPLFGIPSYGLAHFAIITHEVQKSTLQFFRVVTNYNNEVLVGELRSNIMPTNNFFNPFKLFMVLKASQKVLMHLSYPQTNYFPELERAFSNFQLVQWMGISYFPTGEIFCKRRILIVIKKLHWITYEFVSFTCFI